MGDCRKPVTFGTPIWATVVRSSMWTGWYSSTRHTGSAHSYLPPSREEGSYIPFTLRLPYRRFVIM